jgi:hypothetical protein
MKPYLEKNPSQKRPAGVAQGVGPEFKPQYRSEKKKFQILVILMICINETDILKLTAFC